MPEYISPETVERIRALCRQISVAHNLDDEIQRELFSHMEDKLLGYLSGEEKVTEEDAFILMREHFGKPEVIKSMLNETHGMQATVSLMRRLGAIAVASLAVGCVIQLFQMVYGMVILSNQAGGKPAAAITIFFNIVFILLPPVMLWGVLRFWKGNMERGRKLWFYRIERERFIMALILFASFSAFLFSIRGQSFHMLKFGTSILEANLIQMVLQSFLWFWWCDSSPRRYRTLLAGALAWTFYNSIIFTGQAVSMAGLAGLNPIVNISILIVYLILILLMMGLYIVFSRVRDIRAWFEGGIAR